MVHTASVQYVCPGMVCIDGTETVQVTLLRRTLASSP